jgi:segregation and condensation protein A
VLSLRRARSCTFRALTADCEGTYVVVARFLALLELYRDGAVVFEQVSPLGELFVRWIGSDEGEIDVTDEFDNPLPALQDDAPLDDVPLDDPSEIEHDHAR